MLDNPGAKFRHDQAYRGQAPHARYIECRNRTDGRQLDISTTRVNRLSARAPRECLHRRRGVSHHLHGSQWELIAGNASEVD